MYSWGGVVIPVRHSLTSGSACRGAWLGTLLRADSSGVGGTYQHELYQTLRLLVAAHARRAAVTYHTQGLDPSAGLTDPARMHSQIL